ncbi:MAG: DUF2079 domain-containing protein [Dehalococcoidia bacterium]|nr:DUF2079 domain-containing protein [Dehalococcoidia bacterium]
MLFARFAIERHRSFESTAYDFGFFDQIVWNTSHGRFFETTFVPYNFLGQHFEPVLLLFALGYRLGAGAESLLVAQSAFAGAAAIPLYYAVRRATWSGVCALMLTMAFLLSAPLHIALDFDVHPEMMGFFFVFAATYYLAAGRPGATVFSLLPLLALKEDMPLVLAAFALLLFARGHRRHAVLLSAVAIAWTVAIVLVAMPLIRGGSSDLTQRYGYLVEGSTIGSVAPHIIGRAAGRLLDGAAHALLRLEWSLGFTAILSPLTLAAAAPSILVAALSDHPQQSRFDLQYSMAPLALSWVAAIVGVRDLARGRGVARLLRVADRFRPAATMAISAAVLCASIATFAHSSPYSPANARYAPSAAHQQALREALAAIPDGASVSAQGTLVPHLSQRPKIYEFPDIERAEYVIIDPSLPVSGQARAAGYDRVRRELPSLGYSEVFSREGVRVFRRTE